MSDYDNTNSGMLARNERKEKESHPDFAGFINVEGREFWLSGWTKEGKAGSKMAGKRFFSLAVKPKDDQPARPDKNSQQRTDRDDDIPF
jgi:hypothetical protein